MFPSNPKIPIYPRPVSPLCGQSLHLAPQDIIYQDSDDSSQDDTNTRETKRQRIEKLGEQYLRGETLFIMSAGLKGPLGNNWHNPWNRRRRKGKQIVKENDLEVPETGTKLRSKLTSKVRVKDRQVEDWLRRSSAYTRRVESAPESSPTPIPTKFVDLDGAPIAEKQTVIFNSSDAQRPLLRISSPVEGAELRQSFDHISDRKQMGEMETGGPCADHPKHRQTVLQKHQPTSKTPIERRAWVSHATNSDRAEYAALESKRRSSHTVPPSTHLPAFEYKKASVASKTRNLPTSTDEKFQEPKKTMPPPPKHSAAQADDAIMSNEILNETSKEGTQSMHAPSGSASIHLPALSTETSRTSITNLMPSAQIQSLQAPVPSAAELSNGDMIEEPLSLEHKQDKPKQSAEESQMLEQFSTEKDRTGVLEVERKARATPSTLAPKNGSVPLNTQKQLLFRTAGYDRGIDTQDMLAGMSPMVFSTIKKGVLMEDRRDTPVTATRPKISKSVKRASFVDERFSTDSSQSSIKSSLRVAKRPISTELGKENKPSPFGKLGLDMETSEDGSHSEQDNVKDLPNLSSIFGSSPKRLKRVLLPSDAAEPAKPFSSTKEPNSISLQRDAHQIEDKSLDAGQNRPEEGEEFDLDGAIDDLGSYLGTWDAEREASGLAGA